MRPAGWTILMSVERPVLEALQNDFFKWQPAVCDFHPICGFESSRDLHLDCSKALPAGKWIVKNSTPAKLRRGPALTRSFIPESLAA